MDRSLLIAPGRAHPHQPLAPGELAELLSVTPDDVRIWIDEGLPLTADNRVDLFAATNWISWGHLDRCPILARRWRMYLGWFQPFLGGNDTPRAYHVQRYHRLHLPGRADTLCWSIPRIRTTHAQVALDAPTLSCAGADVSSGPDMDLVMLSDASGPVLATGEARVRLTPRPPLSDDFPDLPFLLELVEDLAADFVYEYRHHEPWEEPPYIAMSGSCLDCALTLGQRLGDHQRPWRLCAGVVAHSALANPHFWVEVDTVRGWKPLDPSLPAIARMLGADWRAYARAYAGGCDARRIEIGPVNPLDDVPGGASVGSLVGEAVVVSADGTRRNAWPCIDWVCGDCQALVTIVG